MPNHVDLTALRRQRLIPTLPEGLRFSPAAHPTCPSLGTYPKQQSRTPAYGTADPTDKLSPSHRPPMHPGSLSLSPGARSDNSFQDPSWAVSHNSSLRDPQGPHLSSWPISGIPPGFLLPTFSLCPPLLLGPHEEGGQKFNPLQGQGALGGAVLGREGPGALLWGPLKVTLWPGRHSSPSPSPPTRRPGAKAFVPGSEAPRVQQGPQPISFSLPLSKGRLCSRWKVKGKSVKDPLGGSEKQVGWASFRVPKNHLLLLGHPISPGQSVFARLEELLPKGVGGGGKLVPQCPCYSKF